MFSPGIAGSSLSVPSPAASWQMTRRVFFEDFNSSGAIDLANSKAPGFNWYLSNAWTDSVNYPGSGWLGASTLSPSNVSVSNSVLTINNDPSGFGYGIATAVQSGNSYIGRAFQAGFYLEFNASFAAHTPGSGKVAAVWCTALEFLLGTAPGGKAGEIDFIEAIPISGGDVAQISMHLHDWTFTSGGATDVEDSLSLNQANPPISHDGMGNFWTFGTLWVPSALNNGMGIVRRYFQNQEIPSASPQFYSPTGDPNPSPGNASPASGQFSTMDGQNMVIIIGADATIPISIDWIGIWSR